MASRSKWIAGGSVAVAAVCLTYVGYGSWRTASMLDAILRVGSPISQGAGAPPPGRPADIGYAGNPAAAFDYPFETVAIGTELGDMPAWLIPMSAETGPTDWAIFVHGIGGRRENGYRFLPTLRDAGLPVVMISYRNDEGAPPAPDGLYALGLNEWQDLEAAARFAVDRGARGLVLVGESMGGGLIGQFMRRSTLAPRVSGIVLDAPLLDVPATLKALVARTGAPLAGTLAWGGATIAARRLNLDLEQAAVTETLAAFDRPLFLSHGEGDRIVPIGASDSLAAARKARTLYLRTAGDHIQSWHMDPARYDAELAAFLKDISK